MEKSTALGCAEPFVEVAGIKIGINIGQINWNLTRRMCPVDDADNACFTSATANFFHGENQRCRRSDVAEVNYFGTGRYTLPELFDKGFMSGDRQRHGVID